MQQQILSNNDVLFFLHIPKTAGTTLINALLAYFPQEAVCPYFLMNDLLRASPEELSRYQFVAGHHFYAIHQRLRRKPVCITLIRNPVNWVVSYYMHIVRHPDHHDHSLTRSKSLLEFVEDPKAQEVIRNYQTRFIAASPDLNKIAEDIRMIEPRNKQAEISVLQQMDWGVTRETMLAIAKKRLEEFAFVGIVERLESAWLVLSYLFGWEPPESVETLNTAPNRPDVDGAVLGALHDYMQDDIQLYNYACRLYETQLSETLGALSAQNQEI